MKPLFIVLEALDGVGKTTLAQGLATRLGGEFMNTPGESLRAVGPAVLAALGDNQQARCLFYAASVVAQGARARKLTQGGTTVVMDRYWLSTVSYARARGVADSLEDVEVIVPVPDLTLVLTLDEAERTRRMTERGYTQADRETLDPVFRAVVHAEMTSPERASGLRPQLIVDLTECDVSAALDRVVQQIEGWAATHHPSGAHWVPGTSTEGASGSRHPLQRAEAMHRDRVLRSYFAGNDWDRGDEFLLIRDLVVRSSELLPDYPYVIEHEWDVVAGKTNEGRGDLVFSDGGCRYAVVEVKHIDLQSSGDTAKTKRTKSRKKVKEQAVFYADRMAMRLESESTVAAYSFTNEPSALVLHRVV